MDRNLPFFFFPFQNIGNRVVHTRKLMLETERITAGVEQCYMFCSSQVGSWTALSKYSSGCNEWTGWQAWLTSLKASTIKFLKECWVFRKLITPLFWHVAQTFSSRKEKHAFCMRQTTECIFWNQKPFCL